MIETATQVGRPTTEAGRKFCLESQKLVVHVCRACMENFILSAFIITPFEAHIQQ
jgi:hypothetical protein